MGSMRSLGAGIMSFLVALSVANPAGVAAKDAADTGAASAADKPEATDTEKLLKQLTIAMAAEAIDEQTIEIRDTEGTVGNRKKIHLRLGNVAPAVRGSWESEAAYKDRQEAGRQALTKLVEKSMVWYQAAPAEHQPSVEDDAKVKVVLADVWQINGRHINSMLVQKGHLSENKVYHNENARTILSAEADEKKGESYAELEEALRESADEKPATPATQAKVQDKPKESVGFAFGLTCVGALVFFWWWNKGQSGGGGKRKGLSGRKSKSK